MKYAITLAAIALTACQPSPSRGGADAPDADAAPVTVASVAPGDVCAAACARLEQSPCPEGHPDAGRSCLELCRHDQPAVVIDLHPACVASARTIEDFRRCGVSCKQ